MKTELEFIGEVSTDPIARLTTFTLSEDDMALAVLALVADCCWFEFTPLPDAMYGIKIKNDAIGIVYDALCGDGE